MMVAGGGGGGGNSTRGIVFFVSLLANESGVKNLLWREPLVTLIYSELPKNVGLLWGCMDEKKKGLWMFIL